MGAVRKVPHSAGMGIGRLGRRCLGCDVLPGWSGPFLSMSAISQESREAIQFAIDVAYKSRLGRSQEDRAHEAAFDIFSEHAVTFLSRRRP